MKNNIITLCQIDHEYLAATTHDAMKGYRKKITSQGVRQSKGLELCKIMECKLFRDTQDGQGRMMDRMHGYTVT